VTFAEAIASMVRFHFAPAFFPSSIESVELVVLAGEEFFQEGSTEGSTSGAEVPPSAFMNKTMNGATPVSRCSQNELFPRRIS